MSVEKALEYWEQLTEANPNGCRIHLSGGEPFDDWTKLLKICREAKRRGLTPPEKIETNAAWADDTEKVRKRLFALVECGLKNLTISCDPFHQQFVPIERCRLLVKHAREILSAERVTVRWENWLENGENTDNISDDRRNKLFVSYAERTRLNGSAAEQIVPLLEKKSAREFDGMNCRKKLLRSKHVHIDGTGAVVPGTCAGIILGRLEDKTVAQVREDLISGYENRKILSILVADGPAGLLVEARRIGFDSKNKFASKCHLCYTIRRFLHKNGFARGELGPDWFYED